MGQTRMVNCLTPQHSIQLIWLSLNAPRRPDTGDMAQQRGAAPTLWNAAHTPLRRP